jgi:hypothetical protein
MKCGEIKERLSEYVDDILDPETKALVDEHLSACEDCQHTLASLRAVVSELGALESVEPPENFLDQLHERMEKRFRFPKILRILFLPMRVKIPLEFAGAVAVAILVFSILHTQKDQLRLAETPVGLKQEGVSEQVEMEKRQAKAPSRVMEERVFKERGVGSFGEGAKEEAYKPQLARKAREESMGKEDAVGTLAKARKDQGYEHPLADISKAPPEERETIELALVMKKEIGPEALTPRAAMEAAPAPKKKIDRSLALPQPAPSAKPERDEGVDDSLLKLTRLIELVGGELVSIQYDGETNTPESIWAEIPATQIDTFYNKLKELGDLLTPPEAFAGKGEAVLPVCIRVLPSK